MSARAPAPPTWIGARGPLQRAFVERLALRSEPARSLDGLHRIGHRPIDRHGHAEFRGAADQGAVEGVDLGWSASFDMLEHRGPVIALPRMVVDFAARVVLGQSDAGSLDHREDFVE